MKLSHKHTQQEIADAVGIDRGEVKRICGQNSNVADLTKIDQNAASHETDFKPPIYNIWKVQNKSNEVSHFGNTEQQWLDNLLYLYTNPLDVVIDPFAGGGSTIDAAVKVA